MSETILAILLALGLGTTGLATAAERVAQPMPDAVGLELVDEMAALQAAFGLGRAADARAQSDHNGDELQAAEAVEGLTQAADALSQAMDNAPEQAQPGLQRAWEAVTTSPANERPQAPANGGGASTAPAQAVTAPPVIAPPVTALPATTPPVPAPPVDTGAPAGTPPVDTPAGPSADVPGGRP